MRNYFLIIFGSIAMVAIIVVVVVLVVVVVKVCTLLVCSATCKFTLLSFDLFNVLLAH